jgi:hypothetical protein
VPASKDHVQQLINFFADKVVTRAVAQAENKN